MNSDRNLHFYFLPISAFKKGSVKTGEWREEKVYNSSGTTSDVTSRHFIRYKSDYLENCKWIFEKAFGGPENWCFLCLLPSYLEREDSSLVDMCQYFVSHSQYEQSGFYLYNYRDLDEKIQLCEKREIPTLLIGVSFALFDYAERYQYTGLEHVRVMKTGGMKGRRVEINDSELDEALMQSFGTGTLFAEYGMTECQSQLYSKNGQSYAQNLRMKVVVSDISDPFCFLEKNRTGRINVVDLANIDSCAFIATDDVGYVDENDEVHILGRLDHSDLRGCNLLL